MMNYNNTYITMNGFDILKNGMEIGVTKVGNTSQSGKQRTVFDLLKMTLTNVL